MYFKIGIFPFYFKLLMEKTRPLLSTVIFTIFITTSLCLANIDTIDGGKNIESTGGFLLKKPTPFKYWSVDERFWKHHRHLIEIGKTKEAIHFAWKQLQNFGENTPEGAEARLAMSQALLKRGYSHASFLTLVSLAQNKIGTQVGSAALYELGLLTKNFVYDTQTLMNLLNSNDFDGLHLEIRSFVNYHKALRNMVFGYNKWTRSHILQIQPDSYWGYLFKYWSAIGEVSRDRPASAKVQLTRLYDNEGVHPSLRELAGLQVARLEFENRQFETAYNIYSDLKTLGIREQGRVHLERAWTQYYIGNYSKALGILSSLRAPYFLPSLNPERFVLEILIYRQLCHYEAVSLIAMEFRKTYKNAIKAIKRRRPLKNNKILLSMSLMNKNIQGQANLIDHIRKERRRLKKENVASKFLADILDQYEHLDKRLQMKIGFQIEKQARQVANELLGFQEGVSFLRYMSKLDSLRTIRRREWGEYTSERVPTSTFDRIYWPVRKKFGMTEYWLDEINDYKMLVSSRCQNPESERIPAQNKTEREFR